MINTERAELHWTFLGAKLVVDPETDLVNTTSAETPEGKYVLLRKYIHTSGSGDTYQCIAAIELSPQTVQVVGKEVIARGKKYARLLVLSKDNTNEPTRISINPTAYLEAGENALTAFDKYLKNK